VADPTDAELWRSVDTTVGDVLLPAIPDDQPWARAVAVQLIGLARYAARRPGDRTTDRVDELLSVLDALAANEIIAAAWNGERSVAAVMVATGRALAEAVTRTDDPGAEVRRVLRPVVVRHLDDELGVTSSLVNAFRGRLDD
jgi:hypothetical protein